MADHKITDFVDPSAIEGLKKLKEEMLAVKEAYLQVANELVKGLKVSVDGLDQLERLTRQRAELQQQAAEATRRHSAALEEQTRIISNTTNTISRQLMEQEKLNEKTRDAYTRQKDVKEVLTQAVASYSDMTKRLAEISIAQEKLNERKREEKKQYDDGKIGLNEYTNSLQAIIKQQQALAAEKSRLESYTRSEAKENDSSTSSYNAMSQELARLKKAYRELDEEGRNSEIGQNMLAEIKELGAHLKDMDASMGDFHRNVGDYAIACNNGVVVTEDLNRVLGLQAGTIAGCIEQNKALEDAKTRLDTADSNYGATLDSINAKINENNIRISDVTQILNQNARSVKEAEQQNKQLNEALKLIDLTSADAKERVAAINQKIEENTQIIRSNTVENTSAKKQLKELVLEIAELTLKYRELSDEEKNSAEGREMAEQINSMTERAGELKDAIADVNRAIQNSASDTRSFDQINEGIQLLVNGYGAAKGAATLFGLEEKDLIAVQAKLQAVFVVSNSLTKVHNLLQKESAIMQAVNTLQTKAATIAESLKTAAVGKGTVATVAATAAQKAFNLVAKANPYVLLALGAGAAFLAISKFVKGTDKAAESTNKMSAAAKKNVEIMKNQKDILNGIAKVYIETYMTAVREQLEFNRTIKDYKSLMASTGAEELARLQILYKVATNENQTRYERNKAAKEMKKLYPGYLNNFKTEAILAGEAASAYDNLTKSLQNTAKERAIMELMIENQKRLFQEVIEQGVNEDEIQSIFDKYAEKLLNYNFNENILALNPRFRSVIQTLLGDVDESELDQTQKDFLEVVKQLVPEDELKSFANTWKDYYNQAATWGDNIVNLLIANRKMMKEYQPEYGQDDMNEAETSYEERLKMLKSFQSQVLDMHKASAEAVAQTEEEGSLAWRLSMEDALDAEEKIESNKLAERYDKIRAAYKALLDSEIIDSEEYSNEMQVVEEEATAEHLAIQEKYTKKRTELKERQAQREMEFLEKQTANDQIVLDKAYNDNITRIKKEYAEKLKVAKTDEERADAEKKYNKEMAEASEQYAIESAQVQVSLIKSVLDLDNLSKEERERLAQELAEAQIKLAEATSDAEIAAIKRTQEAEEDATKKSKDALKKRLEAAQQWLQQISQSLNAVKELASGIYDSKIQKVEEEQEAQEEAADQETERIQRLVEQKVITEEEGEARIRAAEAKTAKKNEELEKKKQQLQYRQAIWDKANSVAQCGINTALALMKLWVEPGWPAAIPMMAVVSALGALNLATILATPIPKYAKGTSDHPGGPAIVGDGGKAEIVSYGGEMYLTPDKPTLIDMPKGAEVFPDADRLLAHNISIASADKGLPSVVVNNDYSELKREIVALGTLIKHQTKAQQRSAYRKEYEQFKALRAL